MSLRRLNPLIGYTIQAIDGEVGSLYDFYFTDDFWRLEHAVVEAGGFFSERRLLVAPHALRIPQREPWVIPVDRSRDDILNSPEYDTARPVYRQKEEELHPNFLWIPKPTGGGILRRPLTASDEELRVDEERTRQRRENPHLRSLRELTNYEAAGRDGSIGSVADVIVSDEGWMVELFSIRMNGRTPEERMLAPADKVAHIDWASTTVNFDLALEETSELPYDDRGKTVEACQTAV